ncbi:MAG TPA: CAP domain-containing protein [Pyrinomonadaceae bacterium]|jgi:uncharacterized protein YkwD
MKFPKSFPLNVARTGVRRAGLLAACVLLSTLETLATVGGTNPKTPPPPPPAPSSARPVARLISTSDSVVSTRSRTRPEAATRIDRAANFASMPTAASVAAVSATTDEERALNLINAQRQARGERPLVLDAGLMRLARLHSQNMAREDFFDHVDPDGRDAVGRASSLGIRGWRALGENIAYNQNFDDPAAFAVQRWMTSAKHRENILNSMFTHTGLGIARSADGRVYFTQVFIMR